MWSCGDQISRGFIVLMEGFYKVYRGFMRFMAGFTRFKRLSQGFLEGVYNL